MGSRCSVLTIPSPSTRPGASWAMSRRFRSARASASQARGIRSMSSRLSRLRPWRRPDMSMTAEAAIETGRKTAGLVAIVTGASSGIGAATARELSRRGARVVLAARRNAQLEAHASSIRDQGGEAIAIPVDISDAAQVERLVERTQDAFGRVDVLVNKAGIGWTKLLVRSSASEIIELVNINLTGAILMTRAVLPGMLERNHGSIINVSSVCGRVAVEPLYSATKY